MPSINPKNINRFLLFKLPAAYFSGVRLVSLSPISAVSKVRLKWINKNPFKSLFWAVQGMAAELPTGVLVMNAIRESKEPIAMLVTHQTGSFIKKAVGTIHFNCDEGAIVIAAIQEAIRTNEGQLFTLSAIGTDSEGDEVSRFTFEWSVKLRQ